MNFITSTFNRAFNGWNAMRKVAESSFYGGNQLLAGLKATGLAGQNLGLGIGNVFNPAGKSLPYFSEAFASGRVAAHNMGGWLRGSNLYGEGFYRGKAIAARTGLTGIAAGSIWGIKNLME